MKKRLFIAAILTILFAGNVFSQMCDEIDKEGIRKFLRQPSKVEGKLNLEYAGLSISDTLNWYSSEAWINKLHAHRDNIEIVFYSPEMPNRLWWFKVHNPDVFGGQPDFTSFTGMEEFEYSGQVDCLDLSRNVNLEHLNLFNCEANSLILPKSESKAVSEVYFLGCRIKNVDNEGNKTIKYEFHDSYFENLELSGKANINMINVWGQTSFGKDQFILENCSDLKYVNIQGMDPIDSKRVKISGCDELISLNISVYVGIDVLEISDCENFSEMNIAFSLSPNRSPIKTIMINDCPDLPKIYLRDCGLENLSVSRCSGLNELSFSNHPAQFSITGCENLIELNCRNTQTTDLDLSGFPKLEELTCGANLLKTLDLSANPLLRVLNVDNTQLINLDVSMLRMLEYIYCADNLITSLDFSNCTKIKSINCPNNLLETLIIPSTQSLEYLNCIGNKLTDITAPADLRISQIFIYGNYIFPSNFARLRKMASNSDISFSNIYNAGETASNVEIDLSSEYVLDGRNSTFEWYDQNYDPITLTESSPGVFIPGNLYEGQQLTCLIKNPGIVFYHYGGVAGNLTQGYRLDISVVAPEQTPIILHNHLMFRKNNAAKINRVESGETFKLFASTSGDPDLVKIGLFEQNNGYFIQDITVSRNNNTYTCLISDDVFSGSYMIQPYLDVNGDKIVIERAEGAHFIDKLPIVFENNDIWGFSLQSAYVGDIELLTNMMLKTSVKDSYEVGVETNFQVYVNNATTTSDVRVGLFNLSSGSFVEDITVSKKNKTYSCMISGDVSDGDYMILPYEDINGQIAVVERKRGTSVMDRLPLTVVNDIWGWDAFAAKNAAGISSEGIDNISIHLNNAKDILYVASEQDILNVRIFNPSGILIIHTDNVQNGINLNGIKGIYIVTVETKTGNSSHKIVVD